MNRKLSPLKEFAQSKDEGGLGITDIRGAANKIAATWILRMLCNAEENWVILLLRNTKYLRPKKEHKWKDYPLMAAIGNPEP